MSVSIQNRQQLVPVLCPRLRRLATRTLAALGRSGRDVHVAVVDDREIRRLNRRFLGARRATDVLAFDLELATGFRGSRARWATPSRVATSRAPAEPSSARGSPGPRSGKGAHAEPSRLLGEVVISAETAARHAARLGVPASLELELLVVHGLLHLAGYDDHAPAEARLMHERARTILTASRRRPPPDRLFTGLLPTRARRGRRA